MGFKIVMNFKMNVLTSKMISGSFIILVQVHILMIISAASVCGQIAFSPTMLFLSEDEPVKEMLVRNVTDTPQEVVFTERFGYPRRSLSGRLEMVYDDSDSAGSHSLSGMLRIFPKKVLMPPRSQQIVRFQVLQNGAEKDRVYWTRLGIESRGAETTEYPVTAKETPAIPYLFRQNIGVYYKYGTVDTGVRLLGIEGMMDSETVRLLISASRTGNSPFLGIMTTRLISQQGRFISEAEQVVNLFFDTTIPVSFDREQIKPGLYNVDIIFETQRADLPDEQLVKSPTQHFKRELLIKENTH